MPKTFAQLEFLLVMLAGWMNRHRQAVIAYLQAENEILKAQLKGKPRLTDDERRRLAVLGKAIGRKAEREGTRARKEREGTKSAKGQVENIRIG